jgi:hypothetical protein
MINKLEVGDDFDLKSAIESVDLMKVSSFSQLASISF